MGNKVIYRDKLILVMGMQRSGTTALLEALGQDSTVQLENEAADGPLYDNFRLRPASVIHQHLLRISRRVILKSVLETEHRELDEVLDEFMAYDPLIVWIYRDPIDVWSSAKSTFQLSADKLADWLDRWVRGNQSALRAMNGRFSERIRSVSFHDLIHHRAVFNVLCEFLRLEPRNNLFWREDPKKGHHQLDSGIQEFIAERTSELMRELDRHRITSNYLESIEGFEITDNDESEKNWLLELAPNHSGSIESSTGNSSSSTISLARNRVKETKSSFAWIRWPRSRQANNRHRKSHLCWPLQELVAHRRYTASFWIRAEYPVEIPLMLMQNHEPYAELERKRTLQITPQWQHVGVELFPNADEPEAALVLDIHRLRGQIEISNPSVGSPSLELNQLRCQGLNKAVLEPIDDDASGIRVRITRLIRRRPSSIQIELGRFDLQAGEKYAVAITLRAQAPRTVGVRLRQKSSSLIHLGFRKNVEVATEWSTHLFELQANVGGEAQLLLDLGRCSHSVEIKHAALFRSNDRLHKLYLNDGGRGSMEFPQEDQSSVRIHPIPGPAAKDADIHVTKDIVLLKKGVRYSVSFRARSNHMREMGFGIGLNVSPWTGLEFYRHVTVSTNWQSYYYEFIAPQDTENARIHFDLGGSNVSTEIADVDVKQVEQFHPLKSPERQLIEPIC